MRLRYSLFSQILVIAIFAFLSGCSSSTKNLDPQQELHYDASYDFSDKKAIVNDLVNNLLNAPLHMKKVKPIIIIYPIYNETSEHIDTGGISDDIQRELFKSGRFRFISEKQRADIISEMDYQSKGYVDKSMQVKMGRQLGADYILSGSLRSIKKKQPKQWRVSKTERIYYSLDLTMTDLETAELVYADQAELAREASRPVIGW